MANNTNVIYSDLSYEIMGAIFEVHKTLGPGFVESVYEKALIEEFT
ncbi:MAG: GxxExxY protein, partial [Deltaproteobacteria bacterium]|nr:GxxExxY protein [Deltaproteobacteria bacterium]